MWNYKIAFGIGWIIGFNLGWVAYVTSWITGEDPKAVFASLFEEALPTLLAIDRFFGIEQ